MGRVTDLVISLTVWGDVAHHHGHLAQPVVADLPGLAVRVHQTLAGVVSIVTDGGGVSTVGVIHAALEIQSLHSIVFI